MAILLPYLALLGTVTAIHIHHNKSTHHYGQNIPMVRLPCSDGWTVIMNRFDGSVDFNRNWADYKNGFGFSHRPTSEFWVGLENLNEFTKATRASYSLRVQIQSNATKEWSVSEYKLFTVDSEANKYKITLSGNSESSFDSFTNAKTAINGLTFSTPDADNDNSVTSCALTYSAGWWFNDCGGSACLTCKYGTENFAWGGLPIGKQSLCAARMLIQPNYCGCDAMKIPTFPDKH